MVTGPPITSDSEISLFADLGGTAVNVLVVEVTAPDILRLQLLLLEKPLESGQDAVVAAPRAPAGGGLLVVLDLEAAVIVRPAAE